MYLQEAKAQPKLKCIVYNTAGADKNTSQQQDKREQDMAHELSWANRKEQGHSWKEEKLEAGASQDTRQLPNVIKKNKAMLIGFLSANMYHCTSGNGNKIFYNPNPWVN